jgi:hypothetical protein
MIKNDIHNINDTVYKFQWVTKQSILEDIKISSHIVTKKEKYNSDTQVADYFYWLDNDEQRYSRFELWGSLKDMIAFLLKDNKNTLKSLNRYIEKTQKQLDEFLLAKQVTEKIINKLNNKK